MLVTESGTQIPCVCVTNRRLCREDFYEKIRQIARAHVADRILLREKDLTEEEYALMAGRVIRICEEYSVECILHTFEKTAERLGCPNLHLPMDRLEQMSPQRKVSFERIGASVHSAEQAERAYELGAQYVTAGHVFDTDCKRGIPGRGTDFLAEVCRRVPIPVYGIGGIQKENAEDVIKAGAKGVCLMSGFMCGAV